MNWFEYESQVYKEAIKKKKSGPYVERYLRYAKNLFSKNVPIITQPKHFSDLVGFDHAYICAMTRCPARFYRSFKIQKSNGKVREINEPLPDLKAVQEWILIEILEKIPVSIYAKAYVRGRSIKDNARFHRKQKYVLCLDIRDFFPTVHISSIIKLFVDIGYTQQVAAFLAHLCCLNKCLPQGAPTSPYLSNLIMRPVDDAISNYCIPKKIRYTRYADDVTLSGDFKINDCIDTVKSILFKHGFVLNSDKTRVLKTNHRQVVTGIVVNQYMQIPREKRQKIRQEMYYIQKFGLDSHLEYIGETRKRYIQHLLGEINFALFVKPLDLEMKGYKQFLTQNYADYYKA